MQRLRERLELLFEAVGDAGRILILPHNDPDPDAIASAVALHYLLTEQLGMERTIVYRGMIGRAENKALVRYLGHPLELLTDTRLQQPSHLALTDTQPGAGNIILPPGVRVLLVIDHHAWREETATAGFADVRPDVGATSTIFIQYLQAAGADPPSALATALFHGIKTVTMALSRDSSPEDAAAYAYLQPRVDVEALARIEHAQVPVDYSKSFDAALRAARTYDGLLIAYIAVLTYPDLTAELADVLLRLERAQWVICMGVYRGTLILSVRTRSQDDVAEELVQAIVAGEGSAGGHGTMAGGQTPLEGRGAEREVMLLRQRALQYLGMPSESTGEPLI